MANSILPLDDMVFMVAFLDTLIPPSDGDDLPGAGTLGLAPQVVTAITSNDRIASAVSAALEVIQEQAPDYAALDLDQRVAVVGSVAEDHPMLISSVIPPLYFAYYQHPTVLMGLGLPTRPPFPGGYSIDETDPDLLDLLSAKASS